MAAERDDWAEVTALAEQRSRSWRTGTSVTTGPAPWSTRGRAVPPLHGGDVSRARFYLGRASRLRPLLTYALPVVSVQALLEMARAYITLADPGGAAAVLARPTTSSSNGPTSASCPSRPASCRPGSPPATRARRRRLVAHGGRAATSAAAVHAPVVRRRSASGCTSPGTRSRRRRTPSTGSSASPRAARRSSARVNSAWTPSNHVFRRTRGYLRDHGYPACAGVAAQDALAPGFHGRSLRYASAARSEGLSCVRLSGVARHEPLPGVPGRWQVSRRTRR